MSGPLKTIPLPRQCTTAFVGGLLEHTLSVVNLCAYYAERYPYLNRDLLFTAAAFHDVGKLKELSNFPGENDYTDDGQLLGHIVMGSELVGVRVPQHQGLPQAAGQRTAALHPVPPRGNWSGTLPQEAGPAGGLWP